MSWDQRFNEPIPLPKGRKLVTLRDAARSTSRSCLKAEHDAEEWLAAMEALLLVAESDGPTMFARIGVMRALYPAAFRTVPQIRERARHWRFDPT